MSHIDKLQWDYKQLSYDTTSLASFAQKVKNTLKKKNLKYHDQDCLGSGHIEKSET